MLYEAIVIGAGQAGLAMGYYLKQVNKRFLILDKEQALSEYRHLHYLLRNECVLVVR